MKQIILISLLAIASLSACKKNDAVADDGCITLLPSIPTALAVLPADQARITQLFQLNNISTNNLQFYQYTYSAGTGYAQPGPYEYIRANQYYNSLPVFTGDLIFNFRQSIFYYSAGTRYNSISLTNVPRLGLQQLRTVYLAAIKNYDKTYSTFKDSCLNAQLGYYDLAVINGTTPSNVIKAWKVTLKNFTYPVAFVRDDNDATIYIDNGIRTFVAVKP